MKITKRQDKWKPLHEKSGFDLSYAMRKACRDHKKAAENTINFFNSIHNTVQKLHSAMGSPDAWEWETDIERRSIDDKTLAAFLDSADELGDSAEENAAPAALLEAGQKYIKALQNVLPLVERHDEIGLPRLDVSDESWGRFDIIANGHKYAKERTFEPDADNPEATRYIEKLLGISSRLLLNLDVLHKNFPGAADNRCEPAQTAANRPEPANWNLREADTKYCNPAPFVL